MTNQPDHSTSPSRTPAVAKLAERGAHPSEHVAPTQEPAWDQTVDVVVLGTGAAGLSATLTASDHGLRVLALESTDLIGGTTAYSAGTVWAPDNHFQREDGVVNDHTAVTEYLDELVGDKSDPAMRQAYVHNAGWMLRDMESMGIRFLRSPHVVDYHSELPNTGATGRALEPAPFDARAIGPHGLRVIRPPVPEFTLFNGSLMLRRPEVAVLLGLFSKRLAPTVKAAATAVKLGLRWAADRTKYHRGTRLVMGNGLVGAMYCESLKRGAQVWLNARAVELLQDSQTSEVQGVRVKHNGSTVTVRATRGVVMAGGGFAQDPQMRAQFLPRPTPDWSRAAEGATGDSLRLARDSGAALSHDDGENALWFPSSIGGRRDGSVAVFPHIWDRAKPGLIAVNSAGRRFVDESCSYHRFVRAMFATHPQTPVIPAWLVVDSRSLAKYGLGMITMPHLPSFLLRRHIKSGYLRTGTTLAELARNIGVDPDGLQETVDRYNAQAVTGIDPDFHKGEFLFGRVAGDPTHKPNPNMGPISRAPFYAVAVFPTPLATSLGLRINTDAQVLDERGVPIPGLYAAGNDAASVMGSEYPGAGVQVGSAMTFGWVAARHAAARTVAQEHFGRTHSDHSEGAR